MTLDTDHEAIIAIARRLRELDVPDPESVLGEVLVALRARGWRPTEARPAPDWRTGLDPGAAADPATVADRAAAARRALADHLEAERLRPTPPREDPHV